MALMREGLRAIDGGDPKIAWYIDDYSNKFQLEDRHENEQNQLVVNHQPPSTSPDPFDEQHI